MCAVLAGVYVLALLLPVTRRFFDLTVPGGGMIAHRGVRERHLDRRARALRFHHTPEATDADGGER